MISKINQAAHLAKAAPSSGQMFNGSYHDSEEPASPLKQRLKTSNPSMAQSRTQETYKSIKMSSPSKSIKHKGNFQTKIQPKSSKKHPAVFSNAS